MKLIGLTLCHLLCTALCWAQTHTIQGKISDENGETVEAATVIVKNKTFGAIAGADGRYFLKLPAGNYVLMIKYIGYETQEKQVLLSSDTIVDFVLKVENLTTGTVFITPDGRDPAYGIIQKTVDKREYFRQLTPEYTYKAYTRTKIKMLETPEKIGFIRVKDKKEKADTGAKILYLAENFSSVAVREPNDIKETVTASRVSGSRESYSLFGNLFLRFSLYDPYIQLEGLSQRGFVSPISDNTFFYYDFKLLGTSTENNRLLYKIQIIPKRKNDPVFDGYIWIVDSSYAIHSFDVNLTKSRQMELVDTMNIRQIYFPVDAEAWKPFSVRFNFIGGTLGFKFGGYSTSELKDYNITPKFKKNFFTNEVMSVADTAVKQDTAFWTNARPIALEEEEIKDYREKDSLEVVENSPHYLDSLTRVRNKYKFMNVIFGYEYYNYRRKFGIAVPTPFYFVGFNTMEGFLLDLTSALRLQTSKHTRLVFRPTARFGFSNRKFSYKFETYFNWGVRGRGGFEPARRFVGLAAGDFVQTFGQIEQMPHWVDAAYSLLLERNLLRMFQIKFVSVSGGVEVFNGFRLNGLVDYQYRTPLAKSTDFTFNDQKDTAYTQNILFDPHDVLLMEGGITYTPGNKFINTPDGKIDMGSKYPTVGVVYRRGIPATTGFGSNFNLLRFTLEDKMSFRLFGKTSWFVEGGFFFNVDTLTMRFSDRYHFKGNGTLYRSPEVIRQFGLLYYYSHSTRDKFLAAHLEHNFGGFFLQKIPFIRKLKWQEVVGFHYALTAESGSYMEMNVGLDNIFRVLRIDLNLKLFDQSESSLNSRWGITVGINDPFNR